MEEIVDDLDVCEDESYAERHLIADLKREDYDLIRRINGYIAYLRKSKQGENADH